MADETIEIDIIVNTQAAIADSQKYAALVEALKVKLREVASASGTGFKEAAVAIKSSANLIDQSTGKLDTKKAAMFGKALSQAMREAEKDAKGLDKELRQKPKDVGGVAGAFNKLGSVSKYVFGTVLGVTAVGAIRDVIRWMGEASEKAIKFSQANFALALALREMQRRGGQVDFEKVQNQIDDLTNKFTFFSKAETLEAFTGLAGRMAEFGLTAEQVGKVVETAMVLKLTDVENRFDSLAQASQVLGTYLVSGYGEGAERAGAVAGRAADQLIAFDMGLKTIYGEDIDPLQRALLRTGFIFDQFSGKLGDAGKFAESTAGQIATATADIEDAQLALGKAAAPFTLAMKKAWAGFLNFLATTVLPFFEWAFDRMSITVGAFVGFTTYQFGLLINNLKVLKGELDVTEWKTFSLDGMTNAIKQGIAVSRQTVKDEFDGAKDDFTKMFNEPVDVEGPIIKPRTKEQQVAEIFDDLKKEFLDAQRDLQRDINEATLELDQDMGSDNIGPNLDYIVDKWDEFFSDQNNMSVDATEQQQDVWENFFGEFGNITDEGLDEAFGIWQDYYDKLDDIARKEQQSIEDEAVDYANAIEDANREANQSIEDANRKHREEELKAERDYQEKLRRLKEEYLFNLEDALRERDALQVLRLMRKYEMDKAQIEREKDLEDQARDEAYQRELEDIAIQRQRKLQELAIEHQRKLEEIRLQAERERAEAERNRDQAMEQLRADLEQERQERLVKYGQEIQDLKDRFGQRIAEIFIGLTDEEGMTSEMLDQIGQLYLNMFGENGVVDMSYQTLQGIIETAVTDAQTALQQVQAMAQAAQQTSAAMGGGAVPPATTEQTPTPGWSDVGTAHALGGMEYVNKPTWALFGEAGPEIATFTPINRLNTNNLGLPNPFNGGGGNSNQGGKMSVLIRLSPGLMGEIVDQSLNSFAQIIEER